MKHGKMILGELHADIPVIQGGMGVGISLSGLAGAVAAAGGIGIISTAQIGFREQDFDRDPIACNLRTIGKEIEKARQIAKGGIVGVNIMVATQRYEDYVRAAVLAGADCIISGAGLPLDLPGVVAETESGMPGRSHRTMLAPIVSSTRALSVVTKYWMKKYDRKPDFIVTEGPLAGGHLGFKREELDAYTPENYERELTAMIRQAAELEIPLIAAGGIYDRRDLEHCLSLGVAGVQMGTRFVTTEECDAVTAVQLSLPVQFIQQHRNGGRGQIAYPLQICRKFFTIRMKAFRHCINNTCVGLMQYEHINIRHSKSGI
jgi:nitronate monooxygenase